MEEENAANAENNSESEEEKSEQDQVEPRADVQATETARQSQESISARQSSKLLIAANQPTGSRPQTQVGRKSMDSDEPLFAQNNIQINDEDLRAIDN